MTPRVSMVMPAYNAARFLDEAMASALADDYREFELIAVDDASTDDTPAILARWAERDPRVIVLRLEPNRGIAEAINAGIGIARGEYIARHDADDVLVNRLRGQVEVLDAHPDVVLVSTQYEFIDDEGRKTGAYQTAEDPLVTRHLLNFFNVVGGHAQVMFRRELAREVGGYRDAFGVSEDYDLWTRLARHGRIVVLPFVGMHRRRHGGAATVVQRERHYHSSRSVMRRTLSESLRRDITDEEADAVATLWRNERRSGLTRIAERICREAYARFLDGDPSSAQRRRVRFITARQWTIFGLQSAFHGRFRDAFPALAYGVRWHLGGALVAAARAVRIAFRKW